MSEAKKRWALNIPVPENLDSPKVIARIETIKESWKKAKDAATTVFSDGENTVSVTKLSSPDSQPAYSSICKTGAKLTNDEIISIIEAMKDKPTNQGFFDVWNNYISHTPTRSFLGTNPIRKACESSISK